MLGYNQKHDSVSNDIYVLDEEGILTDILSRLPLKSLFKYTLVCKRWQTVIKSPNFMSMRKKQSSIPTSLLVVSSRNEPDFTRRRITKLLSFSPDRTNNLVSPFLRAWDFIKIVGVSYGLVCYCNSFPILPMSLVICNPLTRKFFSIPENPELIKPPRSFLAAFVLGFTVDSDSNDYKLIKIESTYVANYKPKKAWIYTMNKGCWKRIYIPTPINDDICLDRTSEMATLGDSIHWSCRQVASDSTVIFSFNWSHESFGVISAAQHFRDLSSNSKSCFHLSQLNGELAYSGISDVGVFNVWTLDAYAVGWIMKFSIELVPLIARLVEVEDVMSVVESFRFVGRMRDSDLVFVADEDKSLFLYDLARGEIKRLPFDHDDYCYTVHGYTESLVPVKKNG